MLGSGKAMDADECLAEGLLCSVAEAPAYRNNSCESFNSNACNTVDSLPDPNNYNACYIVFEDSFNSCFLPTAEQENAGLSDSFLPYGSESADLG